MNTSKAIIKLLEDEGVKHIFGHPGEQILPLYQSLNNSKIKHILTRHEQGAVHASDAYARVSGRFGVCIATAGPGALNLVMGVATAYKDSIPMLVITGDNPKNLKEKNSFQSIDIVSIFKPIVIKSFNPYNGKLAIANIKEALDILEKKPHGPVHINLSKDVLLDENLGKVISREFTFSHNYSYDNLDEAIGLLKKSERPLIVVGAGIRWGRATQEFENFINVNKIPITTTYHSNGIISEKNQLNLGMIGIRGTTLANYALNHSDLILILGSKLSDRTIDFKKSHYNDSFLKNYKSSKTKIIHINIDKSSFKGDIRIEGDVKFVLSKLNHLNKITSSNSKDWLDEIYKNDKKIDIDGMNSNQIALKPQIAIDEILKSSKGLHVVNDAGSHTTWVNLLIKSDIPGKLVFSGGMAPMGYGLPASCGVSIAKNGENVILINGDGGFQMNIQELATVKVNNLPILIFVLNNYQLGVIRQWEKLLSDDLRYEVDLENPDFVTIANAYGIDGEKVKTKNDLKLAIDKGLKLKKPYLVEVIVDEEDIPLPESLNK
ncbi:MAG: thiamine pyrophosphate-binding protein [Methanobacteriaceae archaeon]|jgi:acetolactate synthase-1/2/3 large subunit|nr:thiamine pyrophosphate-binding protein [Candidatus Methanorudis spinitermitis]